MKEVSVWRYRWTDVDNGITSVTQYHPMKSHAKAEARAFFKPPLDGKYEETRVYPSAENICKMLNS